jgi:hypothetical protein
MVADPRIGLDVAFFDFPAEHWDHLGMFDTVRHRTVRTKGALSNKNRQAQVKLVTAADPSSTVRFVK